MVAKPQDIVIAPVPSTSTPTSTPSSPSLSQSTQKEPPLSPFEIGPVVGTDEIKFSVGFQIKAFTKTLASSAFYTVKGLLDLQAQEGDKAISIPLTKSSNKSARAALLLRVKLPTAPFISKQWHEEAERRATERELRRSRENQLITPSPPPVDGKKVETQIDTQAVENGKQQEIQEGPSKLPSSRGTSTD
ncbi:hypothetical protein H0H87_004820 [Tephrocybe sp. NHM501043]|nr:hypothetical protein H0H87_004820 [Tephrocybe sp. NHM501043]